MPLITGMPDFSVSAKPLPADLNTAFRKIAELLGGIAGNTLYPGDLDSANLLASPTPNMLERDQLAEPNSVFALAPMTWDALNASDRPLLAESFPVGPFHAPVTIVGVTFAARGVDPVLSSLSYEIRGLDGGLLDEYAFPDIAARRTPVVSRATGIPVPAGEGLAFKRLYVLSTGTLHALSALVWVRGPVSMIVGEGLIQ